MRSLDLEGRAVPIEAGDTIASALHRVGVRIFSRSFRHHRPRGLYCLTGDCPNCLVTVDGEPCVRACVTAARPGHRVVRENAWPSVERDALSVLWQLRLLFPVGFYYKTLLRPRFAWRVAEPLVRRVAGIGTAPLERPPAHREARHHHADVLIAGGGSAGVAAALAAAEEGERVVLADEGGLDERLAASLRSSGNITVLERAAVVGIYEGPLVPVDGEDMLHLVHPARVVVATGAVEQHLPFRGGDLPGVWLGRGAARLVREHGLLPGRRVVFAGATEEGLEHLAVLVAAGVDLAACVVPASLASSVSPGVRVLADGEVVEAHGRSGLSAVVLAAGGRRETIRCDALVLSVGLSPRDGLARQAQGLPVETVGDAGLSQSLPPVASRGFVCLCEDVAAPDLEQAWNEGFRSTELLKRYTTATMGPCQGALCEPHLRAFVRGRAGEGALSARTTARPPVRPIRLEDAAAGVHFAVEQRTALHERHLELGARMEWSGDWKRPESYGDPPAEYWAVRREASVMDVGTLGKILVAGPDATAFVERIYPCRVADLEPGQVRYSLLLNEAGYVFDDGVVCRLDDGYYLTFTSGGAEQAEAWLRDWAETWGLRVHIVNRTHGLGAINVTGPRARAVLETLGAAAVDGDSIPFPSQRRLHVAGVPCLALRLGFTGELSFELHHPRSEGMRLWDALLDAGATPHGLEALRLLRLEKGHILVGQDTDFDSTPAKLDLPWAVRMDKPDFVGKPALERIGGISLTQRLVRLAFDSAAPPEGALLIAGSRRAGYVTSSRFSPVLGHGVALGWLRRQDDSFPDAVVADGTSGRVVAEAFYDPTGSRLRA